MERDYLQWDVQRFAPQQRDVGRVPVPGNSVGSAPVKKAPGREFVRILRQAGEPTQISLRPALLWAWILLLALASAALILGLLQLGGAV